MTRAWRFLSRHRADVVALASLAVVSASITLWWIHPQINSFTIQTHGDQAWFQASAQVAMQTGPFAVNDHLGWFTGFDPWGYPTGGAIGFYAMAWVFGLVFSSSSTVVALIMAVTSAAVATTTYLAIRLAAARPVSPVVAWAGAVAIGISPYVLSKMGHYNVAAIYLLPLLIATLGFMRGHRPRRQLVTALVAVAVVTLVSPLWWTFIAFYFLILGLVIAGFLRSRAWAIRLGSVLGAVLLGGALPIVLSVVRRVSDESWNRAPWDSKVFGGSLTDFLLASPFLRSVFPRLDELLPGTSVELSAIGLIPGLAAIAAVVIAMTAYLGFRPESRRSVGWLLVLLQLTLLTFITLGLGTVQEAVLLLLGVESPLRGWSRLTLLIAIIGLVLISPFISERINALGRQGGRIASLGLVAVVLVLGVADARSIVMAAPRAIPTVEEVPAVDFLREKVGDCPVAQLPVGTYPDFPLADGTDLAITYYYRGFVPYLLNPEGTWSFGSINGTPTDQFLKALPATLTGPDLLALGEAGYCAVLYDKHYAEWVRAKGLDWPGEAVEGLTPTWTSPRFDVYLVP